MLHELGHTLGLWHEQTRPDRDEYVDILWKNISSDSREFHIRSRSEVNSRNVPYDYRSIMHYSKTVSTI